MTQINRIGFNPNISFNAGIKSEKSEVKEETSKEFKGSELKQKSADEVMSFLANSANSANIQTPNKPRTIEVSKYVTPDQAKRIAGFVQGFETEVGKGLKTFESEFGNLPAYKNMSEQAKLDLAAGVFAKANLSD